MPGPSLFLGSAMMMRQSGHSRCSLRRKIAPLKPPPTMTAVLAGIVMAGFLLAINVLAIKRCLHIQLHGIWAHNARRRPALREQFRTLCKRAVLAAFAAALTDAYIAVFDAKAPYEFLRPITAIRTSDIYANPDTE